MFAPICLDNGHIVYMEDGFVFKITLQKKSFILRKFNMYPTFHLCMVIFNSCKIILIFVFIDYVLNSTNWEKRCNKEYLRGSYSLISWWLEKLTVILHTIFFQHNTWQTFAVLIKLFLNIIIQNRVHIFGKIK